MGQSENLRPQLRSLESFPTVDADGEPALVLRDPEGFAGGVLLPRPAAIAASLMDGRRTLAEIQAEFHQRSGEPLALADLERLIGMLDERWLLDNSRFRDRWKSQIELYLNSTVRPAAHANTAYPGDPELLRQQLDGFFTHPDGPGALPSALQAAPRESRGRLCGILSPHIDLARGGPAFAWAYQRLAEECNAEVFVILGTAHRPLERTYALSRKEFDTPLGTARVDRALAARIKGALGAQRGGGALDLVSDELAHRTEHSIEFQVVFLQHVLAGRPFTIVPILVGSFHEFVQSRTQPIDSPSVAAMVAALRSAIAEHERPVALIGGVDLAHIGPRFGDRKPLTQADHAEQADDDRKLLAAVARGDAAALFDHVAGQNDRRRICGLSPIYTLLHVLRPTRGEVLKYGQSVAPDGSSCVTFASAALYG
jgi:AmmeMemoRadiSam system protein B